MEFVIPSDHPALAGHFPGRPVVPAVLILDEVLAGAARFAPDRSVAGIVSAKFTAVLLPDQVCRLAFEPRGDKVRFTCEAGGQTIASGLLMTSP